MADGCADLAPAKAHPDDAAFDLRSRAELELPPGRSVLVPTGLFIELPPGYEAQVRPRSGLALRHNLMLTNSPEVELAPADSLSETGRGAGGFGSTGRS